MGAERAGLPEGGHKELTPIVIDNIRIRWWTVLLYALAALLATATIYFILYLLIIYPLLWLVLMAPGIAHELRLRWWHE